MSKIFSQKDKVTVAIMVAIGLGLFLALLIR